MAGRAVQVMTEADDDDGADGRAPSPFAGTVVDLPQSRDARSAPVDEFTVVDTDDDFQPLEGGEGRLTEHEAGDRPLLDQRRTEDQTQQQNPDGSPRRGESRAERRQRQKEGRERTLRENAQLHAQIAELRGRLDGIEPRIGEFDQSRVQDRIAGLERDIQSSEQQYRTAETRLMDALTALTQGDDGAREAYAQALRDRDAAVMRGQQLLVQKNIMTTGNVTGEVDPNRQRQQAQPQQQQRQAPQPMRPIVQARVQEFTNEHPWLDVTSNDMDNRLAREIDNAVMAEGFDPSTDEYWDELEDRLQKYIPHRFADNQQPNGRAAPRQTQQRQQAPAPQRRGPMVAGGNDRAPQGSGKTVYLSRQRKEALQLAGALDRDGHSVLDKSKYQRILKQYADYDTTNGVARA